MIHLFSHFIFTIDDFIRPSWKEPMENIYSSETSEKVKALSVVIYQGSPSSSNVTPLLVSAIAKSYKKS